MLIWNSFHAVDFLERLVSEMTCYVSSGTLNPTHSLTHLLVVAGIGEGIWTKLLRFFTPQIMEYGTKGKKSF